VRVPSRVFPTVLSILPLVETSVQADPRAVQDPISAVFELADEVGAQTPKIRRVLRYVRVFVWLWLAIDFLVIAQISEAPGFSVLLLAILLVLFLFLRSVREKVGRTAILAVAAVVSAVLALTLGPAIPFGIVLVPLFYLGLVVLDLMRELRGFFEYFALRHQVVRRVREADPVVYVPEGADAGRRALAYLHATDPDVGRAIDATGGVAVPALLEGGSGLAYAFDGYVLARPSLLWTWFGFGDHGLAAFVKAFDHAPTRADLEALRRAVEDVAAATHVPPARIVAVWHATSGAQVAPDAYEFLLGQAAHMSHRGNRFAASLELLTEGEDGTYDRIPVVVASPVSPAARTAPA